MDTKQSVVQKENHEQLKKALLEKEQLEKEQLEKIQLEQQLLEKIQLEKIQLEAVQRYHEEKESGSKLKKSAKSKAEVNHTYYEKHSKEIITKVTEKRQNSKERQDICDEQGIPYFLAPYLHTTKYKVSLFCLKEDKALAVLCKLIIDNREQFSFSEEPALSNSMESVK